MPNISQALIVLSEDGDLVLTVQPFEIDDLFHAESKNEVTYFYGWSHAEVKYFICSLLERNKRQPFVLIQCRNAHGYRGFVESHAEAEIAYLPDPDDPLSDVMGFNLDDWTWTVPESIVVLDGIRANRLEMDSIYETLLEKPPQSSDHRIFQVVFDFTLDRIPRFIFVWSFLEETSRRSFWERYAPLTPFTDYTSFSKTVSRFNRKLALVFDTERKTMCYFIRP